MDRTVTALGLTFPAPDQAAESRTLFARLRSGEAAALAEAYDLHHAYVRGFARKLIGDSGLAEDVVQDTFVDLPRAIRRCAGNAALRTFLLGIAINHSRHYVRAAARRRAATERLASEPAGESVTPEDNVRRAQLAAALSRALDDLSMEHRVAFVLCELEELTALEASHVLNVPEPTVRTRVFHARRQIRAWFERRGIR